MSNENKTMTLNKIQDLIISIRGVQVMLDSDLAEMYDIETKNLNRAVGRNKERFPEKFRFQLTQVEFDEYGKSLRFHFGTSKNDDSLRFQNGTLETNTIKSQDVTLENQRGKHRKYLPFVFTEQGVAMLASVLRSDTAVKVSIQIMQAFVEMKKFIFQNANLFQRINNIEQNLHCQFSIINCQLKTIACDFCHTLPI